MHDTHTMIAENSVGVVAPQRFYSDVPLTLKSGAQLPGFELVFETYGTLNAALVVTYRQKC